MSKHRLLLSRRSSTERCNPKGDSGYFFCRLSLPADSKRCVWSVADAVLILGRYRWHAVSAHADVAPQNMAGTLPFSVRLRVSCGALSREAPCLSAGKTWRWRTMSRGSLQTKQSPHVSAVLSLIIPLIINTRQLRDQGDNNEMSWDTVKAKVRCCQDVRKTNPVPS